MNDDFSRQWVRAVLAWAMNLLGTGNLSRSFLASGFSCISEWKMPFIWAMWKAAVTPLPLTSPMMTARRRPGRCRKS